MKLYFDFMPLAFWMITSSDIGMIIIAINGRSLFEFEYSKDIGILHRFKISLLFGALEIKFWLKHWKVVKTQYKGFIL